MYLPFSLCSVAHKWCPALCSPMDFGPPGSSVHKIFQARMPEWVATSYSRGSSWPKDQTHISHIDRWKFFPTVLPGKPVWLLDKLEYMWCFYHLQCGGNSSADPTELRWKLYVNIHKENDLINVKHLEQSLHKSCVSVSFDSYCSY